jgi:hypothetical protein
LSLILAFTGSKQAIIGGDRRSIDFFGSFPDLEEELYLGKIRTDDELKARAVEACASLQVSDGREKVWTRGEILVGEVTERSLTSDKRRRIYLVPKAYLIVDIADGVARISAKGSSACIALGNKITKQIASELIGKSGGRIDEVLIKKIFNQARDRTPTVSRDCLVFSTTALVQNPDAALLQALQEDCQKSGWKLCAQQS